MKKILLAAGAALMLAGCGGDLGTDFVGDWKTASTERVEEVISVAPASGGYRAVSTDGMWDFEVMLKAESDSVLVRQEDNKKALVLGNDGRMTSYLRNKEVVLVKQ